MPRKGVLTVPQFRFHVHGSVCFIYFYQKTDFLWLKACFFLSFEDDRDNWMKSNKIWLYQDKWQFGLVAAIGFGLAVMNWWFGLGLLVLLLAVAEGVQDGTDHLQGPEQIFDNESLVQCSKCTYSLYKNGKDFWGSWKILCMCWKSGQSKVKWKRLDKTQKISYFIGKETEDTTIDLTDIWTE